MCDGTPAPSSQVLKAPLELPCFKLASSGDGLHFNTAVVVVIVEDVVVAAVVVVLEAVVVTPYQVTTATSTVVRSAGWGQAPLLDTGPKLCDLCGAGHHTCCQHTCG